MEGRAVDSEARRGDGRFAPAALAVSAVAISTSAPLVFATGADPMAIALWRLALMTAFVLGAVLALRGGAGLRLPRREAALLLGLGVVLGLHFGFWIPSVKSTSITASVVIVTAHPLLVAVASHLWLKERATPAAIAGILLALLGVAIIFGTDLGQPNLYGDLLAAGGAVTLGGYLLMGRLKRREGIPVLVYTTYVYGGATLTLAAGALALRSPVLSINGPDLALIALMALVPGMFGHTLYNWALRYLSATVVSATHVIEPIGASLLALWIFGAQPPAGTAIGGAVTLVGILFVARAERARVSAAAADAG